MAQHLVLLVFQGVAGNITTGVSQGIIQGFAGGLIVGVLQGRHFAPCVYLFFSFLSLLAACFAALDLGFFSFSFLFFCQF
jgi:hypothetical protein